MAKERSDLAFHILAFMFAAAVITASLISIYRGGMSIEKVEVDVKFEIGNSVGLDLNDSALAYGRMFAGSSQTRKLNITNTYPFPIKVRFLASKDIEGMIHFSQPDHKIESGQYLVSEFTLSPPINTPIRNYTGRITVEIMK